MKEYGELLVAKMAGDWWASRLSDKYSGKRQEIAHAIARRVEQTLNGQAYWAYGEQHQGPGKPLKFVNIVCDYEPKDLLAAAVDEVFGADMPRHKLFTASQDLFPRKHSLRVTRASLEPKEGYGNWTDIIIVPGAQ